MSDARVVVVTVDELTELVQAAVAVEFKRLAVPAAPTALPMFISVPQACKRYRIGRRQIVQSIEAGLLPATVRRVPGGNDAYFIRTDDADRVLGATV